ncbi:MAG: hypothetical protein JWM99_148 [Verrucomicrobiales bacterium]|nr:hypothetical protein [Verrucomicrobiales bacterium]
MTEFWNQRKALGLLGLLMCIAFFEILFGGKTLFYRDFGVMGIPTTYYQRAAFWNGEIPLWNPYSNCGAPFLAQWGTMCLYPLSIIYLILPFPWSLNFFCVLHLFIGAWGMYRFCRKLDVEEFPSLIGATIFVFNGITLSCLSWPNYCVAIGWMPWVIAAVKEGVETGGRGLIRPIIFASLQLLVGVPELVVLTWLICVGFVIEGLVRKSNFIKPTMVRLAVIVTVTSGIVAAQILPFIDLLLHSQRTIGMSAAKWAMPLDGWVNLAVPLFHVFKTTQGTFFQNGQQFLSAVYLGVMALFLAGVAVSTIRKNGRVVWLGLIATFLIVVSFGPNSWLFSIFQTMAPFLAVARYPVKALLALPLIVALLGSFGWMLWRDLPARERMRAMVVGFIAFLLFALGALWFMRMRPLPYDRWPDTVQNCYSRAAFLLVAFGALSWSASSARVDMRRAGEILLIAVLFFDGLKAMPNQNPTAPANLFSDLVWDQAHPAVPAPRLGEGRVFIRPEAEERLLRSNVADPVVDMLGKRLAEWSHLNLLDLIPKVNGSSTLQIKEQSVVQNLLYETNGFNAGLLDFVGARLETASNVVEWQARSTARPLVSAGQSVKVVDDTAALKGITAAGFSPGKEVFLNSNSAVLESSTCLVTNFSWKPHLISFNATAAHETIASIAQSYFHNWRAFVDGTETPLLRANYAFQAIVIPTGNHRIEIRYRDNAFLLGCATSLLSIVGLALYSRRRPRVIG